jgi:hypothetical protein
VKTKKTENAKKTHETNVSFPCGNFKKMAEMMNNCCPGEGGAACCCSIIGKKMKPAKEEEAKGERGAEEKSKGAENV